MQHPPFPFQSNDSDERKLESVRFRTSPPPLPQRQRGTIWAHTFKQYQHSRALGVLHVGYTPLALVILLYISAFLSTFSKTKENQKKTIKGNHTDYIDTTTSSNPPPTQPTQIFAHDAVTYESTPTPDHKPFCFSVGSSRNIQWGSHVFDIDAFNPIRHL